MNAYIGNIPLFNPQLGITPLDYIVITDTDTKLSNTHFTKGEGWYLVTKSVKYDNRTYRSPCTGLIYFNGNTFNGVLTGHQYYYDDTPNYEVSALQLMYNNAQERMESDYLYNVYHPTMYHAS